MFLFAQIVSYICFNQFRHSIHPYDCLNIRNVVFPSVSLSQFLALPFRCVLLSQQKEIWSNSKLNDSDLRRDFHISHLDPKIYIKITCHFLLAPILVFISIFLRLIYGAFRQINEKNCTQLQKMQANIHRALSSISMDHKTFVHW